MKAFLLKCWYWRRTKPTLQDSRAQWIEDTEMSLAKARFDAEYQNHLVQMLESRRARLIREQTGTEPMKLRGVV